MGRLTAEFAPAFSRDLKRKAKRRKWDLGELEKLIDLVVENSPESTHPQTAPQHARAGCRAWAPRRVGVMLLRGALRVQGGHGGCVVSVPPCGDSLPRLRPNGR